MVEGVLCTVIELQLQQTKFWRQGALQKTGYKGRICPFKHAIQVHCCLSLHGIFHFVKLLPQILHQMVVVKCRLSSVLCRIFSIAIPKAAGFLIMFATTSPMMRSVTVLWTGSLLQLFVLSHQLLYIHCQALDLLSHHHRIWRHCCYVFHLETGTLSVGAQWFE